MVPPGPCPGSLILPEGLPLSNDVAWDGGPSDHIPPSFIVML